MSSSRFRTSDIIYTVHINGTAGLCTHIPKSLFGSPLLCLIDILNSTCPKRTLFSLPLTYGFLSFPHLGKDTNICPVAQVKIPGVILYSSFPHTPYLIHPVGSRFKMDPESDCFSPPYYLHPFLSHCHLKYGLLLELPNYSSHSSQGCRPDAWARPYLIIAAQGLSLNSTFVRES